MPLRHPRGTAYGCFLPDLTKFAGSRRAGPDLPYHPMPAVTQALSPLGGIRSRYGGLRVQGTASSPSSTTGPMLPQGRRNVKSGQPPTNFDGCPGECVAERVGFEPTVPFGTRALQARALGRTMLPLQWYIQLNLSIHAFHGSSRYGCAIHHGMVQYQCFDGRAPCCSFTKVFEPYK